jgi:hypothetical protein
LATAIRNGADLRVYTEFFHDEHINTSSHVHELIREVADCRVTYLLDNRWAAGIITLRQPISLPTALALARRRLFFLYKQDRL